MNQLNQDRPSDHGLSGGAGGPLVCGATAVLPLQLLLVALEIIPGGQAHPLDVATRLRCCLERHADGPHYDFVRELDDTDLGEVWTQWETGRPPESVATLPDCDAHNGRPGGLNDACTLFFGHPGAHSFSCADPEADRLTAGTGAHGP
ncbi:hypothetical protein [Streptomyces sp. NPDC020965]|uniref:hypothetical protein n=1 Tax=Streptomyces sp. NPDC020965 TaxID=3365105 RepID=UPI0037998E5C